ncbi:hypothetical protein LBMAG53_07180 [Planctomycetota bacterium]|nr:hypothetical protein LBMAG53_07180 [Planctomycetota bacterium]
MPESIAPTIDIASMRPQVDFAALWEQHDPVWYVYRVPSHQFLLVESGLLRAKGMNGEVRAGPGEMLCLRRLPRNEYGYDGPVRYWECHLSFTPVPHEAAPLLIEGSPLPDRIVLGDHAGSARSAIETLCLELDRAGDLARLRIVQAAHGLLAAAVAALARKPLAVVPDRWQHLRQRLEANLSEPLSLEELAASDGVGADHLGRAFRRRFGISPMAYRNRARLSWAASLISEGLAVKEVAHRLGFADASTFARAFRHQFGLAPNEMRIAGGPPPAATSDVPFPINRHIRPPGSGSQWFEWR